MSESSNDEEERQRQEEAEAKRQKELEEITRYLMDTQAIRVKSNDVIHSATLYNGFGRETMTAANFRNFLVRQISSKAAGYLKSYFEGQYLPHEGGGWQTGKLRITIEFLPEEEIEKVMNRLNEPEPEESQEPEESTNEQDRVESSEPEPEESTDKQDRAESSEPEPEESADEPKDSPPPEPPSILDDIRRDLGLI